MGVRLPTPDGIVYPATKVGFDVPFIFAQQAVATTRLTENLLTVKLKEHRSEAFPGAMEAVPPDAPRRALALHVRQGGYHRRSSSLADAAYRARLDLPLMAYASAIALVTKSAQSAISARRRSR